MCPCVCPNTGQLRLCCTAVSTGGVGLTAGWGSPAIGVFLHRSFAHGAPCFPVPTVAANKHNPHGRCCTIARRSDNLQACVCVASCHHFPCVPAVRLCVARLASTFLALWPSCSACVRACCSALGLPFLAHSFGGGAVTEVLHDLLCGFALSTVRHDLPSKKKKKKKLVGWFSGRSFWLSHGRFRVRLPKGAISGLGDIHPSGVAWGV